MAITLHDQRARAFLVRAARARRLALGGRVVVFEHFLPVIRITRYADTMAVRGVG
jgi:hypothetical protein